MGWPLGGQRLKSRMVGLSGGSMLPLWEIRYTVPGWGGMSPGGREPATRKHGCCSQPQTESLFVCSFASSSEHTPLAVHSAGVLSIPNAAPL